MYDVYDWWRPLWLDFFYEDLADLCTRASDLMVLFAMVLAFAGFVIQTYKGIMGGDLSIMFKHLLMIGIVVAVMPHYAEWMLATQALLGNDLLIALEVDPISMLINFGTSFADAPFDTGSAPSIVFGVINPMTWFEYFAQVIGAYLMVIVAMYMYIAFFLGFQIQIMAIYLGCAAGPLFLGMLLFEPTRDSAVKYHVGMIAICFWPLGWGLGMLFGDALMALGMLAVEEMLVYIAISPIVGSVIASLGIIILIIIVVAWFLVTLFGAPKVVQKAITTGAQIGMSLIQGGISTTTTIATSAATTAIQMGSGAAMAAGGAALTIGTGGAGAMAGVGMMTSGVGSMASGAASGIGGATKAVQAASSAADKN